MKLVAELPAVGGVQKILQRHLIQRHPIGQLSAAGAGDKWQSGVRLRARIVELDTNKRRP
eukprot:528651-Prorocentrum_minimum.AAC.2